MIDLDKEVLGVATDLRRAAVVGATGDAVDRQGGVLVDAGLQTGVDRFAPSAAPLAVAIEGPGLFVLRDGARTLYSRLGDFRLDGDGHLVDGAGRGLLGVPLSRDGVDGHLQPICVPPPDQRSKQVVSYRIDEQGRLLCVERHEQKRMRHIRETIVPIAQLAIATFPVPERLERSGDSAFIPTQAAGAPTISAPGERGAGKLRLHVVAAGAVDIEGDLRKLWSLRRKGELEVALASADDACVRTALGLVR
jgi:flagellar basal-body rod protein FlgG